MFLTGAGGMADSVHDLSLASFDDVYVIGQFHLRHDTYVWCLQRGHHRRSAQEFYRTRGQAERTVLLSLTMPGSTLKDDQVAPTFKPPFDIIHRIALEARRTTEGT